MNKKDSLVRDSGSEVEGTANGYDIAAAALILAGGAGGSSDLAHEVARAMCSGVGTDIEAVEELIAVQVMRLGRGEPLEEVVTTPVGVGDYLAFKLHPHSDYHSGAYGASFKQIAIALWMLVRLEADDGSNTLSPLAIRVAEGMCQNMGMTVGGDPVTAPLLMTAALTAGRVARNTGITWADALAGKMDSKTLKAEAIKVADTLRDVAVADDVEGVEGD